MSSIDINMSDKYRLLYYANEISERDPRMFTSKPEQESYYIKISDNSIEPDITEYNFDTISAFKEQIGAIWKNQNITKCSLLIDIATASAFKNRPCYDNVQDPDNSVPNTTSEVILGNTNRSVSHNKLPQYDSDENELLSMLIYPF